jgi:hypothetical protein
MTERTLNAPAFQGQKFANACQARNAVLALALAEAGGFGSGSSRYGAVLERYMATLAPRLCFPGRHLAAEGDREPRAAEAPSAALFPALGGGPTTCSGGLGAAMFLSVNWRPRFADPSLLRY